MSRTAYEPLELELDLFTTHRETLPSIYSVPLPPASGRRVRFAEVEQIELPGTEGADDSEDAAYVFAETETATSAETPDAKRRETVRAAAPPPSLGSGPHCSVSVPRLREVVSIVSLAVRRYGAEAIQSSSDPSRPGT